MKEAIAKGSGGGRAASTGQVYLGHLHVQGRVVSNVGQEASRETQQREREEMKTE